MPVDVYEAVTNQILAALDNRTVPWRNPILGRQAAGCPKNLVSDRAYRGTNVFLLALTAWCKGYESPYWLTFRQAYMRGGNVKKGEQSSLVIYWKQLTVEDEKTGEEKQVPMLRHYRVFNVEQCEDVDAPVIDPPPTPMDFTRINLADVIVERYDGPTIHHGGTRALYRPGTDEIRIPEPTRFATSEDYYSTLFHEIIHSTGHSSRLDRGLDTELAPFGSPDYSREELIAEMGSAFLCGHAGIAPSIIENSAAYIQGWIRQLKSDKRLVVQAGGKAQCAADFVLGIATETDE